MTTKLQTTQNQILSNQSESGEIVLYQPDENIRIEVRLDPEMDTVWLSQAQMAELYGTKRQAITKHIKNIYYVNELEPMSTCSILELVQKEGTRIVKRKVEFYNLEVIISVGYRVNTHLGIQFRRWATKVLKEHLLAGYSVNRQLIALQERTDERLSNIQHQLDEQKQQVEFLVDMHRKPSDSIFPTGCVFDAWEYVARLVREAKSRIILIDNYCDERTLLLLAKRQANVKCTIYTRFNEAFDADLEKHNRQYPIIEKVQLPQKEHDRFLIIDNIVYILGDSLKDLGHSLTTVLKTSFSPIAILDSLKS